MFRELFEAKEVNLDNKGKTSDIKKGTMVVLGGQVYQCVNVKGNFFTFEDEEVNQFTYDSVENKIKPN